MGIYSSIFFTFLRFGLLAWGGPVAKIAMLREELVDRQQWITPEKFRRALALYQALPGPEAHELCVYFGMIRAGRLGGFLAGFAFMLPGLTLILLLAYSYQRYGSDVLLPLFIGVAPAVAALIIRAAHRIGTHTLIERSHWLIAGTSIILAGMGTHFIWVILFGGVWQGLWSAQRKRLAILCGGAICVAAIASVAFPLYATAAHIDAPPSHLLVEGLKAGLLSFGGAHTSIPFLQNSMVGHHAHITPQVFLDSLALSSVIPAPLIIFGTFLGFMADGLAGALWMTVGIFLPAFLFTLLGHSQLERLIENRALHGILDGISAAVVGLLTVTALHIAISVVTGWPQLMLFSAAIWALYRIKSKWAIPMTISACGIAGYVFFPLL